MRQRNLIISFLIVLISGCAGKSDISNLELASNINQRCFLTTAAMDIYYFDKGFNQKYEMLSPNAPWCSNDIFMKTCQKVVAIPKRGEIKITKIFDKSYGSSGHCWEIFAKSKREPDIEFSLPACWVEHNPDIWVKPKYPWEQKKSKEPLQIDTKFLEEVRCSF